jgi:hypothetical protein
MSPWHQRALHPSQHLTPAAAAWACPPAEVTGLFWTKLASGCQLGVRRGEGSTVNFLGFKDKVRGPLRATWRQPHMCTRCTEATGADALATGQRCIIAAINLTVFRSQTASYTGCCCNLLYCVGPLSRYHTPWLRHSACVPFKGMPIPQPHPGMLADTRPRLLPPAGV